MPIPNFRRLKATSRREIQALIAKSEDSDEKAELESILKTTQDMENDFHPDPADFEYGALN